MYLRYVRVGKHMLKKMQLPVFQEKLSAEKDLHFKVAATHLDDFRLNGQPLEHVFLALHAAHHYINNWNKAPLFHSNSFTGQGGPR